MTRNETPTDIVERLRELAHPTTGLARGFDDAQGWLNEAADEIERLRHALAVVKDAAILMQQGLTNRIGQ